jgi:hypothetical protein
VTATRDPVPPATTPPTAAASAPLLVTVTGPAGAGRVTADAAGVECRAEECSFPVPVGTELTLRAVPRVDAARFRGWSGACTGDDDVCRLTVGEPGEPITVTARFSLSAAPTAEPPVRKKGSRPTYTDPGPSPTDEPTYATTEPPPDPTSTEELPPSQPPGGDG